VFAELFMAQDSMAKAQTLREEGNVLYKQGKLNKGELDIRILQISPPLTHR
jgi:hypothetical protein